MKSSISQYEVIRTNGDFILRDNSSRHRTEIHGRKGDSSVTLTGCNWNKTATIEHVEKFLELLRKE